MTAWNKDHDPLSRPPPPKPSAPAGDSVTQRRARVVARIAVVEATICDQMFTATIEEAMELAQSKLRHEVHMQTLNDERAELAFLKLRLGQFDEAIKAQVKNG